MDRLTFANMLHGYAGLHNKDFDWQKKMFHKMFGVRAAFPVDPQPQHPTATFVMILRVLEARTAVKQARKLELADRVAG